MGASFPLADPGSNALSLQVANSHGSQTALAPAPPHPSLMEDVQLGCCTKKNVTSSLLLALHTLCAQEVTLVQVGLRTSLGAQRAGLSATL